MANQSIKIAVRFGVFILSIIVLASALIFDAWMVWIMFITWVLDAEFDRVIILATSAFWIITGGLTWAILRSRRN
jgi:hypothetical protein